MKTVFLSSTGRDLQAYRDAAFEALGKFEGWHCVRMEDFTPHAGKTALDYCQETAADCTVFVGLIGHCYGSRPPGSSISYTEHEYDAAQAVPRLMFVAPDSFPVPMSLVKQQTDDDKTKQESFRVRILNGGDLPARAQAFDDPQELATAVLAALRNWEQTVKPAAPREPTFAGSGTPVVADPRTLAPGSAFRDVDAVWCPELVVIPAGRFLMGSPDSDPDRYPEEQPVHEVTFRDSFAMGRFLITFSEYDSFCDATGRRKPADEGQRGRYPVINVCWNDAHDYVVWLAARTGKPYRLPSEAEWEYACRAGTPTRFYRGDKLSEKHANYNSVVGRTTPVGAYPVNPWGLYDMHGNVWQLVDDPYHDDYVGAPADGSVWMEGGNPERRVVRGGSFAYPARDNRSAVRCDQGIRDPDRQHGFRVVRSL